MRRGRATVLLLAAALVLIAIGIAQGEPGDVLQKAVHICMECIGIG
jgi:hypothetical protein